MPLIAKQNFLPEIRSANVTFGRWIDKFPTCEICLDFPFHRSVWCTVIQFFNQDEKWTQWRSQLLNWGPTIKFENCAYERLACVVRRKALCGCSEQFVSCNQLKLALSSFLKYWVLRQGNRLRYECKWCQVRTRWWKRCFVVLKYLVEASGRKSYRKYRCWLRFSFHHEKGFSEVG